MDISNVPEAYQEDIEGLRHGSYTMQTIVEESIEEAQDWPAAQKEIASRVREVISEAEGILEQFCNE